MASPQIENGHFNIANELAEALMKTQLGGYESRILWAILRKTYGWNKKEDWISGNQLQEMTGLRKQHIWRAKKQLLARNIVTTSGYKIALQKDYTRWKKVTISGIVTKSGIGVTKSGTKVTKYGGHKIHYTKDTITKDNINTNVFIGMFKTLNPSYERLFANKTQRDSITRMVEKFGVDKMTGLLKNLPEIVSRPYAPRITTPYELEKNMGKLVLFLKQEKNKIKKGGVLKL